MAEISTAMAATTGRQVDGTAAIADQARHAAEATRTVSATIAGIAQTATEAEQMSALVHDTITSVADQLSDMRSHLVASLRGSVVGNRRQHARIEVDMAATLTIGGRKVTARVRDLSLGGALLEMPAEGMGTGLPVVFATADLQDIAATVCRVDLRASTWNSPPPSPSAPGWRTYWNGPCPRPPRCRRISTCGRSWRRIKKVAQAAGWRPYDGSFFLNSPGRSRTCWGLLRYWVTWSSTVPA